MADQAIELLREILNKHKEESIKENNAKWLECMPEKVDLENATGSLDYHIGFNRGVQTITDNAKQAGLIVEETQCAK